MCCKFAYSLQQYHVVYQIITYINYFLNSTVKNFFLQILPFPDSSMHDESSVESDMTHQYEQDQTEFHCKQSYLSNKRMKLNLLDSGNSSADGAISDESSMVISDCYDNTRQAYNTQVENIIVAEPNMEYEEGSISYTIEQRLIPEQQQQQQVDISVEVSSFEDNAVEELPRGLAIGNRADYHIIDEEHPESLTNVLVCSTLQDIATVKQRKVFTFRRIPENVAHNFPIDLNYSHTIINLLPTSFVKDRTNSMVYRYHTKIKLILRMSMNCYQLSTK